MVVAIIPARGGSKGIPRKNLQPVLGVPLLAHTIRHALAAELVDRVVVSTDDAEIAGVSRHEGAEVIYRPADISGDTAPSEAALLHVLETLAERGEEAPVIVVLLQPTSPIRRPADVDGAIRMLRDGSYDSVFSTSPAHGFVWEIQDGRDPVPLTYDPSNRPMRQETGERLSENGSIYVVRAQLLRETGIRLGGRVGVYRMGFLGGIQIDEPEDLVLARWILENRKGRTVPGEPV